MTENDELSPPGDAPTPAWGRVGAALLIGALAGAAWFAMRLPAGGGQTSPGALIAVAPPVAAASSPDRGGDIAELMRTEPAEAEPPAVADGQVLVCGQAVDREALADDRLARTMDEAGALQAVAQFTHARLTDDDHARAVGAVMRVRHDAGADAPPSAELAELAVLADASRDARVWQLARDECRLTGANGAATPPTPPHCQPLTARRLVALDGENAHAWLALAAEEPAAVDEALHQASLAPRWDDHATAARRFVDRVDAKAGLHGLAQMRALLAVPAVRSIESRQILLRECSADRVRVDANRAQLCLRLADNLQAHGKSVADLTTAGLLAQSIGHARADEWRDEARVLVLALRHAATDAAAQERVATECSLGLSRELLLRSAHEGEVAAMRAWINASGVSTAQWLDRANAEESAEQAIKLASAAQAASAPR